VNGLLKTHGAVERLRLLRITASQLIINRGLCCGLDCRRGLNIERTLRVAVFQHAISRRWPTFSRHRHFCLTRGLPPSRLVLDKKRPDSVVIRVRRVGPEIDGTEGVVPISICPVLPGESRKSAAIVHVLPLRMGRLPSKRGALLRASVAHTEVISLLLILWPRVLPILAAEMFGVRAVVVEPQSLEQAIDPVLLGHFVAGVELRGP
jgi:hypothetical protein